MDERLTAGDIDPATNPVEEGAFIDQDLPADPDDGAAFQQAVAKDYALARVACAGIEN